MSWSGLTVITGTTIAKTWADLVRSMVINRFADSTTRDSTITGSDRVEGMYADLANTESLTRFNGVSWDTVASAAAWTDYSASLSLTASSSNPTKGNSTFTARYQQIGKTVIFQWRITIGSTFSAGSGSYRVMLPVTAQADASSIAVGSLLCNDSGTSIRVGQLLTASTTYVNLYYLNGSTVTLIDQAGIGTAWATGDWIEGSIVYEAA